MDNSDWPFFDQSPLRSVRELTLLQDFNDYESPAEFLVVVGSKLSDLLSPGGSMESPRRITIEVRLAWTTQCRRSMDRMKHPDGTSKLTALELAVVRSNVERVKISIITNRWNRMTTYWSSRISGYFPILLERNLLEVQYTAPYLTSKSS